MKMEVRVAVEASARLLDRPPRRTTRNISSNNCSLPREAISDIVSDQDVPVELQGDPDLWSGCISGAYRDDAFLDAFDRAGFYGMEIVNRDEKRWRTIQGIEFRSITVVAHKGKQGPCWESKQAVIYRGPWRKVIDDDGHVLERGKRIAVL